MFCLSHQIKIQISNIPIQWIPKIELYYPDLPQFPIMYIHTNLNRKRLIACPVAVSYDINDTELCTATFDVLLNLEPDDKVINKLQSELEERIGFSNKITFTTIKNCCNGNKSYINLLEDLWQYIKMSYGDSIPFGRYYEEIYSIPRFVAAWQPKTGRQSEMRMLYNFMSAFGEEAVLPANWSHLEYYVIPNYDDARAKSYDDFPAFKKLYECMKKLFANEFSNSVNIAGVDFKVMPKAWKQNKDDFINLVTQPLLAQGKINEQDKYIAEELVDAFNRHAWRAAYFISAYLTIEISDYRSWTKNFFKILYDNGGKLKGYSEKVMACYLQQGFGKDEIIPVDTWIETFYMFPLGISDRSKFYDSFTALGKLERVIWLASQSNKTNMKNFFDILWCQRYGTIGNSELRGVNPLACCLCKLKGTCVGLKSAGSKTIYLSNNLLQSGINDWDQIIGRSVDFVCITENYVPKKVYRKGKKGWYLTDEFSGYKMTANNKLPQSYIDQHIITVSQFVSAI